MAPSLEVAFTDGHTSEFKLQHLVKEIVDFRHNPIQPVAYERPKPKVWSGGAGLVLSTYIYNIYI